MAGKMLKGEIRRSQLITTYGVGAIVAVEDESFMVAGIDRWPAAPLNLHEPRLERRLRVNGFQLPPTGNDRGDIPVVRFPSWVHCPSCKRLDEHRRLTTSGKNHCNSCGVPLIPSRFVACCSRGHIDDFPYFRWIHAGSARTEGEHRLTLETSGSTAALDDIIVKCSCGKQATMAGAFGKTALAGVVSCQGRRPWLVTGEAGCTDLPRVLQRGASNVWFSVVHSAISIPPWSEGAFLVLNKYWEMLRHVHDESVLTNILDSMGIAAQTGYNTADLVGAVASRQGDELADREDGDEPAVSLKRDEYLALIKGRPSSSNTQLFVCEPAEQIPQALSTLLDKVMLVKKLREVRALESFSRIEPARLGPGTTRPPLAESPTGWLPAVEVLGEGIFMRLDPNELTSWENRPAVRARADGMNHNYQRTFETLGGPPDRIITARFVLLHTLAHTIIDQWALDSGYPASSLRERIYAADDMAGLLIYTATSDSAGSLGGVVAEAHPKRLGASFTELASRAGWCSADPLCIESTAQGVDGLNLAACHSCCLLPEVSCEEMNLLLDRAMLVGTPEDPTIGFLRQLMPGS